MRSSSFTFKSEDDLEIFVYCWLPDGSGLRGVVQIAHGMGEHAGRYERVARHLTEAGYAVYANDQRGHGRSSSTEDLGHMADQDGWNTAVRDLHLLNRRIAADHPEVPRVLLGHSMGSLMAQQYLIEHGDSVCAAVLSGSTGDPGPMRRIGGWLARFERLRLGKRGMSGLLLFLFFGRANKAFEPARTDYDWLSRDRQEVALYIDDPLCGFVLSAQSLVDMLDALGRIYDPEALARVPDELPLLIFSGEEDPIHSGGRGFDKLVAGYEAAGLEKVTRRIYERGRHEMFNETNRDEVLADLIAWLDLSVPVRGDPSRA